MGLEDLKYLEGETPLDEDEIVGLLISDITNQKELNEYEQKNIEEAVLFFKNRRSLDLEKFLSEKFIKDLHKKMFQHVWSWAGKFRLSEKSIGIDPKNISVEVKKLLDDCHYWVVNDIFPKDEIAIRLKHRLVKIHLFSNGNGRHSRLLADIMMEKVFKLNSFSWGGQSLYLENDGRKMYLEALKAADLGDYEKLLLFAKS